MDPVTKYPILHSLLNPFRRSQSKTIALLVAAVLDVAQANSLAIAGCIASWFGIRVDSALNRQCRFLRNPRIDELSWARQLLRLFPGERLLVAIDWTEWHSELRMLSASVVCGRRAIPVSVATFNRRAVPRSQNCQENTFLRVLSSILREVGRTAVFLCDRGFRRVSWIRLMLDLEQHFVVRLQSQLVIHLKGRRRTLKNWRLNPGQAVDLGWGPLRQDGNIRARVIGVWARNAKEPWWLATDLADPLAKVVSLYDRRMTIEEQFRDTKGCRFGLRLEWMQFKKPAHLNRFMYLLGTALVIWTAAGAAAEHRIRPSAYRRRRKAPASLACRRSPPPSHPMQRLLRHRIRCLLPSAPPTPRLRLAPAPANQAETRMSKVMGGQTALPLTVRRQWFSQDRHGENRWPRSMWRP